MKKLMKIVADYATQRPDYITSSAMFSQIVVDYYKQNPDEYTSLLETHGNDEGRTVKFLIETLNDLLKSVPISSKKRTQQERLVKALEHDLAEFQKDINNHASEYADKSKALDKAKKDLAAMPTFVHADLSYSQNNLTALVKDLTAVLTTQVQPTPKPADMAVRSKLKFERKMPLKDALFDILCFTRRQTLPVSILNLKGWAARFVKMLRNADHHQKITNAPTCLIFRSRQDTGAQKGGCGKTNLSWACQNMLRDKGLNVPTNDLGLSIPTYNEVMEGISGKTFWTAQDQTWNEVDWQALNNYCDGNNLHTKGKYVRAQTVFSRGCLIATTNYDPSYSNDQRYPFVEFNPVACADAIRGSKAYAAHQTDGRLPWSDAWETLFHFADKHADEWLDDYYQTRLEVASQCARQRTKLELILMAIINDSIDLNVDSAYARDITRKVKEEYPGEIKWLSVDKVVSALDNLGLERINNGDTNPFRARYALPKEHLMDNSPMETPDSNWEYIEANIPDDTPPCPTDDNPPRHELSICTEPGKYAKKATRTTLDDVMNHLVDAAARQKHDCYLICAGYNPDAPDAIPRRESEMPMTDTVLIDCDNDDSDPDIIRKFEEENAQIEYHLWETASSTPEKPKFRAIIPLDNPVKYDSATKKAIAQIYAKWQDEAASWFYLPTEDKLPSYRHHKGHLQNTAQLEFLAEKIRTGAQVKLDMTDLLLPRRKLRGDWHHLPSVKKVLTNTFTIGRDCAIYGATFAMTHCGYGNADIQDFLDEAAPVLPDKPGEPASAIINKYRKMFR